LSKNPLFFVEPPTARIFVVCWEWSWRFALRVLTTTPHRGQGCGGHTSAPNLLAHLNWWPRLVRGLLLLGLT